MTDARISALVERAFDYRGHVTVSRHDGTKLVGFVYDRSPAHVEMFDEHAVGRHRIALDDIADIVWTGEDCADKAQQMWARRRGKLEPRTTTAWGEWAERPTLILVGLPLELRGIARVLGTGVRGRTARGWLGADRVIARATGMGGGAARVVEADRPRLVISCGVAGGLEPSLATGDLVVATSVRDESGDNVVASASIVRAARDALAGGPRVVSGELLSVTRVAATSDDKRALAHPGRVAVDVESWACARAAQRAAIPWLVLRVVLDPLSVDLPAFTRDVKDRYIAAAVRHALRGPVDALELARLGMRTHAAIRALAQAVNRLAPALRLLAPPDDHT
jgi:hypothetical protein